MKGSYYLQLVALGGIWGASFLFMRIAAKEFFPASLIEVRVLIASLFLGIVLAWRGELHTLRAHWKPLAILGLINTAIPFSFFAYAAQHLSAGLASILNSTATIWGAVIALVWFREATGWRQGLGLLLGILGVGILAMGPSELQYDYLSIALGLGAAFLYGVSAHFTKRKLVHCPPLTLACGSLIAASLYLMPSLYFFSHRPWPTWNAWMCVLTLGIFCTAIAYLIFYRLVSQYGVTRAMVVPYLIPIFGILWGVLFLHESLTWGMTLGGAIALTGTYLVTQPKPAKTDSSPEPPSTDVLESPE